MPKFFNGTNGPVVYDGYGRIVGGGEWIDVEATSERIEDLVERGYLVEVVTPSDSDEANEESAEGQPTPKRNSRSVKK